MIFIVRPGFLNLLMIFVDQELQLEVTAPDLI